MNIPQHNIDSSKTNFMPSGDLQEEVGSDDFLLNFTHPISSHILKLFYDTFLMSLS
jgi:hypothetical protein